MKATIILPTTSDRGPLLEYAVDSALRQTVSDIELLIIGDGVNPATRDAAEELANRNERVRFFEYPKHERRGEPYRHEIILNEAGGEIICYLCDRDLMFSDHVEEVYESLKTCDITSTLCYDIRQDGRISLAKPARVGGLDPGRRRLARLTCVAHTRAAYLSLPYGWRTTPEGNPTDSYMWQQFLDDPRIRARVVPAPTVLYFQRRGPEQAADKRRPELVHWHGRLRADGGEARIHRDCMFHILQDLVAFHRRQEKRDRLANRPLRVKIKSWMNLASRAARKLPERLRGWRRG